MLKHGKGKDFSVKMHSRWKKWKSLAFCNLFCFCLFGQLNVKSHWESCTSKRGMASEFSCDICANSFASRGSLHNHTQSHEGKTCNCPLCNKSFTRRDSLKTHSLIHIEEKMHKCTQCNYSTNRADILRGHIMKHTGEKTHCCDQCEYSTIWSSSLKVHKRTHSGEKPHKCTLFDFSCSQTSGLKDAHGGETVFVQQMQLQLQTVFWFANAHEETHWGETFQMLPMWIRFHTSE